MVKIVISLAMGGWVPLTLVSVTDSVSDRHCDSDTRQINKKFKLIFFYKHFLLHHR